MKYFISIGAGLEQKYALDLVHKLGYKVIGFDGNENCECRDILDEFYHIDINESKEIIKVIENKVKNKCNILGVLPTPIGRYVSTSGIINDYFKFIGPSQFAAETCSNKTLVNKFLKENNLPLPIQYSIDNIDEIKFPVIAKPVFGSGSRFVKVLYNKDELRVFHNSYDAYSRFGELLIEEFIDGKEYSVEILVQKKEITFFHIIDKEITELPYRQEISYTSPVYIPKEEYDSIYETLNIYIKNLNVEDSIFHVDVIFRNNKSYIIDIAPRPGGVNIMSRIINYTYDFDFIEYWIKYMDNDVILPDLSVKNYIHSQYLCFENCRVKEIPTIKDLVNKYNIVHEEINVKSNMELGTIIDCNGISERGCYIIKEKSLELLKEKNKEIYKEFKNNIDFY